MWKLRQTALRGTWHQERSYCLSSSSAIKTEQHRNSIVTAFISTVKKKKPSGQNCNYLKEFQTVTRKLSTLKFSVFGHLNSQSLSWGVKMGLKFNKSARLMLIEPWYEIKGIKFYSCLSCSVGIQPSCLKTGHINWDYTAITLHCTNTSWHNWNTLNLSKGIINILSLSLNELVLRYTECATLVAELFQTRHTFGIWTPIMDL